jgi:AraC-like DNA-binding protein
VGETALGQTRQTASERGILDLHEHAFQLDRVPVAPRLSGFAERHWRVRWDLPPGRREVVQLLPHPCVNLFFDGRAVTVAGVGRELFTYPHEGRGQVFGVKFRPGGFYPFLGRPVSAITDSYLPLAALWGEADAARLARDLTAAGGDLDALIEAAEGHLARHWPEPDPEVDTVGHIVEALLRDRTIVRVEDVTERFGLSMRTLQRLFQRYVGVTPKWVLKRYRLHEAAARLAEHPEGRWADVAADLGYFDQSHFIRDFTRAVGLTPTAYAEASRRPVHT